MLLILQIFVLNSMLNDRSSVQPARSLPQAHSFTLQ